MSAAVVFGGSPVVGRRQRLRCDCLQISVASLNSYLSCKPVPSATPDCDVGLTIQVVLTSCHGARLRRCCPPQACLFQTQSSLVLIQMPSSKCPPNSALALLNSMRSITLNVSAQAQRKCSNQTMAVARDVLVEGGIVFRVIGKR